MALVAAAAVTVACGGGGGPTGPAGPPAQLVKSGGDQQAWYFNNPLPTPFQVRVQDANGRGVAGVVVSWAVTTGGGSVAPASSTTNADGVATATLTLTSDAVYAVSANAAGLPQVEFMASASTPPTSGAVTVGNDFFSPRDVVVQVTGSVTWTWNPGFRDHNVIYVSGPTPRPANSPTIDSGTHTTSFGVVGVYGYVCNIHAGMEGTVSVVH
ncbi:MAG: Ig-like domain-containing protein [Longimicrobiales bacterium]